MHGCSPANFHTRGRVEVASVTACGLSLSLTLYAPAGILPLAPPVSCLSEKKLRRLEVATTSPKLARLQLYRLLSHSESRWLAELDMVGLNAEGQPTGACWQACAQIMPAMISTGKQACVCVVVVVMMFCAVQCWAGHLASDFEQAVS